MRKLNIAILGTRGIPNNYGGFEEVAANLAGRFAAKGHTVTVYNEHIHPYQQKVWKGVSIIHKNAPVWMGAAGQFIYDLNCILDSRRRNFDITLMLGYTSSSIWGSLYNKKSKVIINMDGLEWKRAKYSGIVKRFLLWAEWLGIRYADAYVADSSAIKSYLDSKYDINSCFIPYGAETALKMNDTILTEINVEPGSYYLLVARMEPENNIDLILGGFRNSSSSRKFIVVGNTSNSFGSSMVQKYKDEKRIIFMGSLYHKEKLAGLTNHCAMYFHGHSVGGTNPSLLEAMAAKALVAAHRNPFNEGVLGNDGHYFGDAEEVKMLVENPDLLPDSAVMITNNYMKILNFYNWEDVANRYERLFLGCLADSASLQATPDYD